MSQQPPEYPYNQQPNGNNQQYPYNQQQSYPGQPPYQQQYNPQQIPAIPQQYSYPQPGQQIPVQDPALSGVRQPKKKRPTIKEQWNSGPMGKCGIIAVVVVALLLCGVCSGTVNAVSHANQVASTPPIQPAQNVPARATTKPVATVKPKPTPKPKPTTPPTPTQSPAQLESTYKASATDTDIATLDKDGANDQGNDVHFTCTILAFVKDSSGNTAGANVTDAATSSIVQVLFTPGTDISQLNAQDTLEVWGNDQGVSTGTNAFGASVQEVVVQANYLTDQTTGYSANS